MAIKTQEQFITIIAAMSQHRVIGFAGSMPWHMPADLAHFKKKTLGKPVLMGRKTYESLGKPLPNRRNIVISRRVDFGGKGIEVFHSFEDALYNTKDPELMIIGGATIFEQALPIADRMVLTFIDANLKGDTFFPEWDQHAWQEVLSVPHKADDKNPYDYQFVDFERVRR